MANDYKFNDFNDRPKIGIITAVYPQLKTVDLKYTSQMGVALQVPIPYAMCSGTWGSIHMPIIGDRVLVINTKGERPFIQNTLPLDTTLLPYLDPGELAHQCENGSYVHLKNRRKRIMSTNTLIDYTATKGPNGETDIEYEPGGVTIQARSHVTQDEVAPRWNEHSFMSVQDNGDVTIQSMVSGTAKGLFHFDGMSGHAWWHAGDSKVQEYIELNPVKQEVVIFSDGDIHLFSQNDQKISTYTDQIVNVCGAWQIKTGVPTANIPSDFDQITLDGDLNAGDIRIDNTGTTGAKIYIHSSGDFDIIVDQGNVNLTVTQGSLIATVEQDVDITSNSGNISLNAPAGFLNLTAENITIAAQETLTISANEIDSTSEGPTTITAAAALTLSGNPILEG